MTKLATLLERLYALAPRGALLGLDRVRDAATRLGDVHQLPRYAHVAGTNGKGSTVAFLTTMGERAGLRTGAYTSPHLSRFAERIRVGGKPISDDLLASCLEQVLALGDELTFFEVATLTALLAFRASDVELAILEVGLGGRLDATNVAEGPSVQAVTRIAFDHTDRLGSTLTAIATEKAGIMRPGSPVVIGRLHPDAEAVIRARAAELDAPVVDAMSDEESLLVDTYPPSLAGPFQRHNAMVAVAVATCLDLPSTAIAEGLVSTRWPGRCEILETADGYVLLDCAHNADGALALKNAMMGIAMNFPRRSIALVFGCMADKNWRAMLDRLTQVTGPRVYVTPPGRAATPTSELSAYLEGQVALSPGEALAMAREKVGRGGIVVVTGSIFLVGQVRAYLLGMPCDPPVAL